MKRILILALAVGLVACGGDSDDTPADGTSGEQRETVSVSGINSHTTINRTDPINLDVGGISNSVTVTAGVDIGDLDIDGIKSEILLAPGAAAGIKNCAMKGINNVIYVPDGESFTCSVKGSGNVVARVLTLDSIGNPFHINRHDDIALWVPGQNQTIQVTGTAAVYRLEVDGMNNLLTAPAHQIISNSGRSY